MRFSPFNSAKRQRRRAGKALLLRRGIFFLMIIGLIYYLTESFRRSDIFKIDNVNCSTPILGSYDQSHWCDELKSAVIHRRLTEIDTNRLEAVLKKNQLGIFRIKSKKILPSTFGAEIFGRIPLAVCRVIRAARDTQSVAQTATESAAAFPATGVTTDFLVDKNGLVFAESLNAPGLPIFTIRGEDNIKIGKTFSSGLIAFYIQALSAFREANFEITAIEEASAAAVPFLLRNGPRILLDRDKSLSEQVSSLQLIMDKYKIEGKRLRTVDLRFVKPVVVYD